MVSTNRQAGRDSSRRWRQSHPDEVRAQKRLYYIRSRERLRDKRNGSNKARSKLLRANTLRVLGDVCSRCGYTDSRALQIDHRFGGGIADRARFVNREQFLRAVMNDPSPYQLLCANCNAIKKIENREFGRGRPRMAAGVIPRLKTTSTITED